MITNKKTGEKVTWREFFRQWHKGMQEITPLQQTVATQFGQIVSLIGVIWGIIFSIRLGYWWMMVILIGGVIVLGVQMLGNWQKKVLLRNIEAVMNQSKDLSINIFDELNKNQEVKNGDTKLVG